ncbi:aminotransferase [Baffinella frigidus]|nr:aminotransferase [Cryptophyta sp. CCMP2293]
MANIIADAAGVRRTDMDSKKFLTSFPRGGYTAARTLGGWHGGAVVLLDYHVGRIERSVRLLYPGLDIDRPAAAHLAEEGGQGAPSSLRDTHPATSSGASPGGAVRIFFAGEPDSAGINAAGDMAALIAHELGGARGEVRPMRGATLEDVAHGGEGGDGRCSVFVLECEGDGAPTFSATKLLRALTASDATAAPLAGVSFAVLGIARSACAFSAASLGPGKFAAAHKLDARLEVLGGVRRSPAGATDVEVEDVSSGALPWIRALKEALSPPASPLRTWLDVVVRARMAAVLGEGAGGEGGGGGEAMVLLTCYPEEGGGKLQVVAMATPLPDPAASAVVEVGGKPRLTPLAKDTQWVTDRAALEAAKGEGVSEVILPGDGGVLLEGLVTNFFVIDKHGTLLTAPDKVLLGHVRALVISACRAANIPLRLQAPKVKDMATWKGCFLTSTVRVVQPIRELRQPSADGSPVHLFADLSEVLKVQALVLDALWGGEDGEAA